MNASASTCLQHIPRENRTLDTRPATHGGARWTVGATRRTAPRPEVIRADTGRHLFPGAWTLPGSKRSGITVLGIVGTGGESPITSHCPLHRAFPSARRIDLPPRLPTGSAGVANRHPVAPRSPLPAEHRRTRHTSIGKRFSTQAASRKGLAPSGTCAALEDGRPARNASRTTWLPWRATRTDWSTLADPDRKRSGFRTTERRGSRNEPGRTNEKPLDRVPCHEGPEGHDLLWNPCRSFRTMPSRGLRTAAWDRSPGTLSWRAGSRP